MRGDPRYAGQSGHQRGSVPSQNVGGGSAMYNSSGFKSGHMEVSIQQLSGIQVTMILNGRLTVCTAETLGPSKLMQ